MDCAGHAAFANNDLADFFPVDDAICLQHFVRHFFLAERAVLFFEDVAARELAGRISASDLPATAPEFKAALAGGPVLWLHAVSVGEVGRLLAIASRQLEPRLPGFRFVVSTTTSTGHGRIAARACRRTSAIYYPADLSGVVRRALDTIQTARHHPGRSGTVAQSSLAGAGPARCRCSWSMPASPNAPSGATADLRSLFRPIFSQFRAAGCQEAGDAAAPRRTGLSPPRRVRVAGNLKFDAAQPDARPGLDVPALLRQIGVNNNAKILVAGSTHAGEEAILAEMLPRLRAPFPRIVSRPGAAPFRARQGSGPGTGGARRPVHLSRRHPAGERALPPGALQCLLVNSTGELKFFYEQAAAGFRRQEFDGARAGRTRSSRRRWARRWSSARTCRISPRLSRAFLAREAAMQVPDAAGLEAALAAIAGRRRPPRGSGRARLAGGAGKPGRNRAHGAVDQRTAGGGVRRNLGKAKGYCFVAAKWQRVRNRNLHSADAGLK